MNRKTATNAKLIRWLIYDTMQADRQNWNSARTVKTLNLHIVELMKRLEPEESWTPDRINQEIYV